VSSKLLTLASKQLRSQGHLSDLSGLFTSLTESKAAVETIEEATKTGDHVLTQEDALELAWAKNAIREREKELKKITPREVWRDMLAIQHRSLSEHKAKLEKQRLATLRQQSKKEDLIKHTVGVVLLVAVLAAIYHYGF
jgi:isoaspartyl peptidase/L-asparaginase-like protein (Ntn-hydrolase superfamily)